MIENLRQTAVKVPLVSERAPAELSTGHAVPRVMLVVAVTLAAYIVTAFVLTHRQEFWSPDSAVRFVQMESLRRAGYRDVSVPYPAASLDPEGRYFPAGPWFHFVRGGRHYLQYLPYFPAVSAPLYGAFGFLGLAVLPMAAGLLTAWITYRVLRRRAPPLALWGTMAGALGTPLIVYSGVFWDHTLAVALAAGALALIVNTLEDPQPRLARLAAAGALLGLGVWLRNEMYLLTVAAVGLWPLTATQRRITGLLALGGGAGAAIGLQWVANVRLYGSILGYKGQGLVTGRIGDAVGAGTGRLAPWISDKLGNLYFQIFSPNFYAFDPPAVVIGLGMCGALLLGGLLMRRGVTRQAKGLITAGGAVAAATAILVTSSRTSISGLIPAAPFLLVMMLSRPARMWERFLWRVCATFTAAVIITGSHGGLQWGPRYLLPILPALVWLAAAGLDRIRESSPQVWPALRRAAGMLVAASVLVQTAGVEFAESAIARNVKVNASIRTAPTEVVVTSLEWLVLGAGPIYFEKQLMHVDTLQDFRSLVDRLAERRVVSWTYVPRGGALFRQEQIEEWTADRAWRFRTIRDNRVNGIRVITYAGGPARP